MNRRDIERFGKSRRKLDIGIDSTGQVIMKYVRGTAKASQPYLIIRPGEKLTVTDSVDEGKFFNHRNRLEFSITTH